MLPRAQVRPLLGGAVGFGGPGFRPKKVKAFMKADGPVWVASVSKGDSCLTTSTVWNHVSLSAGHRSDILSCPVLLAKV